MTVALSAIAAQFPDAFHAALVASEDQEIRLPLQKLLDQLTTRLREEEVRRANDGRLAELQVEVLLLRLVLPLLLDGHRQPDFALDLRADAVLEVDRLANLFRDSGTGVADSQ